MSNTARMEEKLSFYQRAYEESHEQLKLVRNKVGENEELLHKSLFSLADEFLGSDLSDDEKDLLQKQFGFSFSEYDRKFTQQLKDLESQHELMENDPRTKEYLEMVITPDLDFVLKLEQDETFNYLVEQNFHNNSFQNEPYFEIWGLKYQPRFWKYKSVANKKAKEFKFENYIEMFQIWSSLRVTFESLIGDKKVEVAVKEAEAIQSKMDEIKAQIDQIPTLYLEDTKSGLAKLLYISDESKFEVFSNQEQVQNALSFRQSWNEMKTSQEDLTHRMNAIMENITQVEKLLQAAQRGIIDLNSPSFEDFYNNENPTAPVYQLIPEHEWDDLKQAFADKGIELGERKRYEKVQTKISVDEKRQLLDKYGVKEGEIFIDETLVGKKK